MQIVYKTYSLIANNNQNIYVQLSKMLNVDLQHTPKWQRNSNKKTHPIKIGPRLRGLKLHTNVCYIYLYMPNVCTHT